MTPILVTGLVLFGAGLAAAQTERPPEPAKAATPVSFEVASVKKAVSAPAIPWAASRKIGFSGGGRVEISYINLSDLLTVAFGVEPFQISGPDWLGTQCFDISALAPAGAGKEQIPLMLQRLLSERFNLQYRRQRHTFSVYALEVAPGTELKPGIPDDAPDNLGPVASAPGTASARTYFGIYKLTSADGVLHYEFQNITMSGLAQFLTPRGGTGFLEFPVFDMTNLGGHYHVFMDVLLSEAHSRGRASASLQGEGGNAVLSVAEPPNSLMHASLAKQGIKLVRRNADLEQILIDRIERTPTPN